MHSVSEYFVVISFLLLLHTNVFYIIIIKFLSIFFPDTPKSTYQPTISVVIAAYNEEKVIAERIANIMESDYDMGRIEILIGSDKSSDGTNAILLEAEKKYSNLRVFVFDNRRGKAAILNDLVREAQNEIIVFTDANTEFSKDALKRLGESFSNEKIGGVCGKLILSDQRVRAGESVEEKSYWQLESFLKNAEGKMRILIGANGGIYSIRKNLYRPIPLDKAVTDDLYVSLAVLSQNKDFIYCENATAFEDTGKNIEIEYKRKIRFAATNYQTITHFYNLFFKKNIFIPYAFISHKIIRWFQPHLLIVLFISSLISFQENSLIYWLLICQTGFYLAALIGWILSLYKIKIRLFTLPFFFMLTNYALAVGFVRFLRGRQSAIWQSTAR
ncbi:MAG: glycosyltransferase [Ignavibacteria bacterium]|nr:glycosyltransferase [Ignavibacteria bacterium]